MDEFTVEHKNTSGKHQVIGVGDSAHVLGEYESYEAAENTLDNYDVTNSPYAIIEVVKPGETVAHVMQKGIENPFGL